MGNPNIRYTAINYNLSIPCYKYKPDYFYMNLVLHFVEYSLQTS